MDITSVFKLLQDDIHSVVFDTINEFGRPETRVTDIMLCDENSLYFITARGKNFYEQVIDNKYVSLTGFKGNSTLSQSLSEVMSKILELNY